MQRYLLEIYEAVKKRHTRAELRELCFLRAYGKIPKSCNLRHWVAYAHMKQQEANAARK